MKCIAVAVKTTFQLVLKPLEAAFEKKDLLQAYKKWELSLTISKPCKRSMTCVHSLESWDFSEILFRIGIW